MNKSDIAASAVSSAAKIFANSMKLIIAISFGYLLFLWLITSVIGKLMPSWAPGITLLAMYLHAVLVTYYFWQPALGGMIGLGEFLSKKDDPNEATTFKVYLLTVIAGLVAGHIAFVIQLIGANSAFFEAMIAMIAVMFVILAFPGPMGLDVWLPRIALIFVGTSLIGVLLAIDPGMRERVGERLSALKTTDDQVLASRISTKSREDESAQQVLRLEEVEAMMNCDITLSTKADWSPDQVDTYDYWCTRGAHKLAIRAIEVGWPSKYDAWRKAHKSDVTKTIELVKNDPSYLWYALPVVAALWWLLSGKASTRAGDSTTGNSSSKNQKGCLGSLFTLTLVVLGVLYLREHIDWSKLTGFVDYMAQYFK